MAVDTPALLKHLFCEILLAVLSVPLAFTALVTIEVGLSRPHSAVDVAGSSDRFRIELDYAGRAAADTDPFLEHSRCCQESLRLLPPKA